MPVPMLSASDTAAFLERHPEIQADQIPSYGLTVYEGDYKYLVGLQDGAVTVMDITAYEGAAPINEGEAAAKAALFDLWGIVDPYGRQAAAPGGILRDIGTGAEKILTIVLITGAVIGGIWLWSNLKK